MALPYVTFSRPVGGAADTPGVHGPQLPDIRAMIAGQFDPHDPEIGAQAICNSRHFGPTGLGDPQRQQHQSGHTNNLPTNPSAEYGFGVGPERRYAHYPVTDNPNPFRMANVLQRAGGDAYSPQIYRPETVAYWADALTVVQAKQDTRQRASGYPPVQQPPSVPFVATVPPVTPGGW